MGITAESQKFLDQVENIVKKGYSVPEACKQLGKKPGRYYSIQYHLRKKSGLFKKKRKSKTQVIDLAEQLRTHTVPSRLMLFVGSPQALSDIVRTFQ